jgi:hypothetical protein
MEKRNKKWRFEQRNKVYISKMRLFASYGGDFILNDERVNNPHWIMLYGANWNSVYKTVRTPCSCYLCQGEKYSRRSYKKETRRLLDGII